MSRMKNEDGYLLIAAVLALAGLSILGIMITRMAGTETWVARNTGEAARNYYDAESGVIDAMQNSSLWLSDAFLLSDLNTAGNQMASTVTDADGNAIATIEARCIYDPSELTSGSSGPVAGLSDGANSVPEQQHITPPPSGSGFSATRFIVRRYAVTATATDGSTQVQAGVWRVFNR